MINQIMPMPMIIPQSSSSGGTELPEWYATGILIVACILGVIWFSGILYQLAYSVKHWGSGDALFFTDPFEFCMIWGFIGAAVVVTCAALWPLAAVFAPIAAVVVYMKITRG